MQFSERIVNLLRAPLEAGSELPSGGGVGTASRVSSHGRCHTWSISIVCTA